MIDIIKAAAIATGEFAFFYGLTLVPPSFFRQAGPYLMGGFGWLLIFAFALAFIQHPKGDSK